VPTESLPDDKRPLQFTLRTLLIVSALAATLGAVRWLGAEVLPFILMAVGIWLTARTKARHLLVWLVPALWSMCAFGSWHHRGDEYGHHFHVCILPCIWLALLELKFGPLSEVYQLLIPLAMDLFDNAWREHGLVDLRHVEQDRLLASVQQQLNHPSQIADGSETAIASLDQNCSSQSGCRPRRQYPRRSWPTRRQRCHVRRHTERP
jgi:hypothetical protein